ncbi:molybdate ABC transporter substrate-binding protein [Notoacmeibacter marinus]|uniref:molybdate ABC transporter substrate-binding protein n=1 Tax=Notoacmeibacter marinus TaxID=1876515 RepID=UPI000DF30F0E|nr:molybdate ABC transporter substrate-binding protein [Notoacmeibacter marinus]
MLTRRPTRRIVLAGLTGLTWFGLQTPVHAKGNGPLVFAAASMTDALNAVAERYLAAGGTVPRFSFAASSILAKQIAQGAPADLFVSASAQWMDWLEEKNAIETDSRTDIARTDLVIAGPADAGTAPTAAAALGESRFAMGDPGHVPAGIYARQALANAGLWSDLTSRAVLGENARIALELVRRGEVARAIVYASDLASAPELAPLYVFPSGSHDPIAYPAALTGTGQDEDGARAFLDFLVGPEGQAAMQSAGFRPIKRGNADG